MTRFNNQYSQQLASTIDILKSAKSILVAGHMNMDGDTLGSQIALSLGLKKINKNVIGYNKTKVPNIYSYLENLSIISNDSEILKKSYDCLVIIDCPNLSRVCDLLQNLAKNMTVINIDHHITNSLFGTINLVNPEACACGEIVFDLLTHMEIAMDKDIAQSVYTSILTDTGQFKYRNTNSRSHQIVSELMCYDIDASKINRLIYENIPLKQVELFKKTINNIEYFFHEKVVLMKVYREFMEDTKTFIEHTESFIDWARQIENIEMAVAMIEIPNTSNTKISFRSNNDQISVDEIAETFNGGGHAMASGALVNQGIDEIQPVVLDRIQKLYHF